MGKSIFITGSEGLIGKALADALQAKGERVEEIDLRSSLDANCGDTRDAERVCQEISACRGIVHLAAISRVVWAERRPLLCQSVNVEGTCNIIHKAWTARVKPWLIFASSREVYGQPMYLPVSEDTPLIPLNVYGRSKLEGERLVLEARNAGLRTVVVRLSNVYGSTNDHIDRVVPAFVWAALKNGDLQVEGSNQAFDFTYIDDVVRGLMTIIEILDHEGTSLPPLQLLTGVPTSLGYLAESVVRQSNSHSRIVETKPRSFDVSRFYGDPKRARSILGWEARVSLKEGLDRLIEQSSELKASSRNSCEEDAILDHGHHWIDMVAKSKFMETRAP